MPTIQRHRRPRVKEKKPLWQRYLDKGAVKAVIKAMAGRDDEPDKQDHNARGSPDDERG